MQVLKDVGSKLARPLFFFRFFFPFFFPKQISSSYQIMVLCLLANACAVINQIRREGKRNNGIGRNVRGY